MRLPQLPISTLTPDHEPIETVLYADHRGNAADMDHESESAQELQTSMFELEPDHQQPLDNPQGDPHGNSQENDDQTEVDLVAVAIDCPGDDAFTYSLPASMSAAELGHAVQVPFGPRRISGIILRRWRGPKPTEFEVKDVIKYVPSVVLPAPLRQLIEWAATYYHCSPGQFIAGTIPAVIREGRQPRPEIRLRAIGGAEPLNLTPRQLSVYRALGDEALLQKDIIERTGCSASVIKTLVSKGALQREANRPINELQLTVKDESFPLTEAQQHIVDDFRPSIVSAQHLTAFLYGVTGSGKTLVYMELVEIARASGLQSLVLLPEIGLTPQLAARFRTRFSRVVVWHSAFSDSERLAAWQQVASGEVDLVIGARSALFAPFARLGLIICDEEHDQSYKQDSTPRYQARDLAVVYGKQCNVPVLLGSATPSLETYYNVQQGRYTLYQLRERPGGGTLPKPIVVDMREECRLQKRQAFLSRTLVDRLKACREAGEQAIVLLNRRGWSPHIFCLSCSHVLECPNCAISTTYHKSSDQLRCHYCGYHQSLPQTCPSCGSSHLSSKGIGTEQLVALIQQEIPQLRMLRVDADTVGTKQGHAKILQAFNQGEADCLVGTQMVSKGLDFPKVTLVGIVGADQGLHIPDFRAPERTYQLISQVSGRAGRGDLPGVVVVQAFDPQSPAIQCALYHKPKTFYTTELATREQHHYPPLGGMVRVLWRSPDQVKVQQVATEQGNSLALCDDSVTVLPPCPAGLPFLQGQHRWHCLIKASSRGYIQQWLRQVRERNILVKKKGVVVVIDVDPYAIT